MFEEIMTIDNVQFKITYDQILSLEQRQNLIDQIKSIYNLNSISTYFSPNIMNLSEHVIKSLKSPPNILNLDAYTELPEKMKKLIKD